MDEIEAEGEPPQIKVLQRGDEFARVQPDSRAEADLKAIGFVDQPIKRGPGRPRKDS